MTKTPRDLDYPYRSVRPIHAYFRLLNLSLWRHLWIVTLFALKMLPQLLLPLVISQSIYYASSDIADPWSHLVILYSVYLVVLVSNIPFHVYFVHCTSRATRDMELRLRASLVRRLQQLSMRLHGDQESGRLQSKVLRDVEEIVRMSEVYFNAAIGSFIGVIFAFGYTLKQEPKVAFAYLIATPIAIGLMRLFRGAMRRRNDVLRREFEGMSQRVSEMIDMVPVTRAHGAEEFEMESIGFQLENVRTRGQRVDIINAVFGSSVFVVFCSTVVAIVAGVTWLVIFQGVGIDKIALYAALFQMVIGSVQQLLGMMPQLSKSMASIRSLGEILECPDIEENEGKTVVGEVAGHIDFRNIHYRYPGQNRPAVVDFSLSASPGQRIAFVGESGSGKSTLMQLTIGFLRPLEGQILLDGTPMEAIDMRSWRRHIAMVPQQTILFSGNIRDNICYGHKHYSDEQVWRTLEQANLAGVIRDLPQGLDTRVGENGLKLSGGQRQRLAIARALIRDPRVIILDEATSALDVISEREVQVAIENLVSGRTTFIVAHRLSTIRQANLVVVMKEGKAIEIGPPEELRSKGGAFSELSNLQ